jgi:hypothetical protein
MAGTEPLARAVQEQATAHTRAASSQEAYELAMQSLQREAVRLQRVRILVESATALLADRTTGTTGAAERERLFVASWDDAVRLMSRADAMYPPRG